MNSTTKRETVLIIKGVIRIIISELSLNFRISNIILFDYILSRLVLTSCVNNNLYTTQRTYSLITYFKNKLIRGAIFPSTIQQLLLEFIEILDIVANSRGLHKTLSIHDQQQK